MSGKRLETDFVLWRPECPLQGIVIFKLNHSAWWPHYSFAWCAWRLFKEISFLFVWQDREKAGLNEGFDVHPPGAVEENNLWWYNVQIYTASIPQVYLLFCISFHQNSFIWFIKNLKYNYLHKINISITWGGGGFRQGEETSCFQNRFFPVRVPSLGVSTSRCFLYYNIENPSTHLACYKLKQTADVWAFCNSILLYSSKVKWLCFNPLAQFTNTKTSTYIRQAKNSS